MSFMRRDDLRDGHKVKSIAKPRDEFLAGAETRSGMRAGALAADAIGQPVVEFLRGIHC